MMGDCEVRGTDECPDSVDAGFSITEVVVAIVLFGVGVIALLTALVTLITSSTVHREEVSLDAILRSSAESILSRQTPYVDCADPSSYTSALPTDPANRVSVSVVSVAVWDGASPPSYLSSCNVDPGAALVTLRATTEGGTSSVDLEIVKRRSGS